MVDCTVSSRTPAQTQVAPGIGMLPFFANQHVVGQTMPRPNNTQENLPLAGGLAEGSQAYLHSSTNLPAGSQRAGHLKQQSQPKSSDSSVGVRGLHQTFCFSLLQFLNLGC